MGGSSKSQTVGYKYYVGMHMALTHGPVDKLLQVKVDDREAWSAEQSGPAQLYIDKADLFGGESREGGIQGTFDFETGHSAQGQNSYLLSKLGPYVPAFRGICGVVLRQMFMGLNPYLKVWKFRISRVHVRQKGIAQWYDAKSEIANYSDELGQQLNPRSTGWKYKVTTIADLTDYSSPSFDDSAWPTGQTPFGNPGNHPYAANSFFPKDPITYWTEAAGSKIWLRKHFTVSTYRDYNISIYADNYATVYVNGVMLLNDQGGGETNFQHDIKIPKEILNVGGDNVIVAWVRGLGGWSYAAFKWGFPQYDMNPAHIIRECLTDPDWGMGYQDADIDDASFMAAADRLYDEQMGMSLIWDTQTNIEEFIKIVVKHIDAALYVERTTGKFVLKLIRNDYDVNSLITLDESNIDKISDFTRPSFGELTNSVTVTFWDFSTGEDSTLTVQDIALSQMQGCTINTAVQYPGFTTAALATRVAQRDLKTLSTPLATCTIYANRDAASLNIGKCFKLTWPDYEINELVMRVTGIAYGDGKSNRVRINCVQDIFSLPEESFIPVTPPSWSDPSIAPTPLVSTKVFEIPYLELVQTIGQNDIDSTLAATPEVGYVGAAAVRSGGAISARMFDDLGSGYVEVGNIDFSPGAYLNGDITELQTTFAINGGEDLDQVQLNTWFQIDNEIMSVTAISETSVTVKRGCLDTLPAKHTTGAALVFWDNYAQGDNTELVSSDIAKVKICPVSGAGQLALEAAPEQSVTIVGRAARPYPPAAIRINSAYYPKLFVPNALALSWVHRDRKQQTASLVGFTEGSIGPEAGTTYTAEFYGETGVLRRSYSGISGTSQTWTTEAEDSGLTTTGADVLNNESFISGIPLNFGTLRNQTSTAPTAVWNSAYQAAELTSSVTNEQTFWDLTAFPLMSEMDFTADIEYVADYDLLNQRGIGMWLTGPNAPEGYNITHVVNNTNGNNEWKFIRWTSAWTRTDSVKASLPFYNVGDRMRFRVVWSASSGVFNFYVNDVLIFTHTDTTYKQLRPGVFFYRSKIRLHEILLTGKASTSRLNNKVNVKLKSVRNGLASYQTYSQDVTRIGYGYSYGINYGGA